MNNEYDETANQAMIAGLRETNQRQARLLAKREGDALELQKSVEALTREIAALREPLTQQRILDERRIVDVIAEQMLQKLATEKNRAKDAWTGANMSWLAARACDEVLELVEAVKGYEACMTEYTDSAALTSDLEERLTHLESEAADVANFAAMIVDVARRSFALVVRSRR